MAEEEELQHGMTEESLSAKHRRLRGSDLLKYPPNTERCRQTCGHPGHDIFRNEKNELVGREHRCFLGRTHETNCQFSSECGVGNKTAKKEN